MNALPIDVDIPREMLDGLLLAVEMVPPCPTHGYRCIPHALRWIEQQQTGQPVTQTQCKGMVGQAAKLRYNRLCHQHRETASAMWRQRMALQEERTV